MFTSSVFQYVYSKHDKWYVVDSTAWCDLKEFVDRCFVKIYGSFHCNISIKKWMHSENDQRTCFIAFSNFKSINKCTIKSLEITFIYNMFKRGNTTLYTDVLGSTHN